MRKKGIKQNKAEEKTKSKQKKQNQSKKTRGKQKKKTESEETRRIKNITDKNEKKNSLNL